MPGRSQMMTLGYLGCGYGVGSTVIPTMPLQAEFGSSSPSPQMALTKVTLPGNANVRPDILQQMKCGLQRGGYCWQAPRLKGLLESPSVPQQLRYPGLAEALLEDCLPWAAWPWFSISRT